ncbi:MAG: DUF692 domain-containing protein [Calditrichia bacterium]
MIHGVGLGLRRDLADDLIHLASSGPAFVEFAPENWMGMGGFWRKKLDKIIQEYPILLHGLSLSIGSPDELDWNFLKELKAFLNEVDVQVYSEHLSYTKAQNAHLFDLLPIPFREDAIKHVSHRIRQVQDYLGRRIAIENVSYYTPVAPEMDEATFISAIVEEADCHLLLDVNNVYVNAFNHQYNAKEFIKSLPLDRVRYIHMAGHEQVEEDLIIDTHGQPIIDPVFDLFEWTIRQIQPVPVLLERDFNIPEMDELLDEVSRLNTITRKSWEEQHVLDS